MAILKRIDSAYIKNDLTVEVYTLEWKLLNDKRKKTIYIVDREGLYYKMFLDLNYFMQYFSPLAAAGTLPLEEGEHYFDVSKCFNINLNTKQDGEELEDDFNALKDIALVQLLKIDKKETDGQ